MANSKTYGVVIQARTSSTRLPGKVLLDVVGKPMLHRQVERLRAALGKIPLVVATSSDASDDPLAKLCRDIGVSCFRGPLSDVMQRFIQCGDAYGLSHIVRVGGDDPLIDPDCCLELVRLHELKEYDFMYASNREGWPYGCAAELISIAALEYIHASTNSPHYLEHTIPYFFQHPEAFRILKVKAPKELRRPDLAFTVDYPEDIDLLRKIFTELKPKGDLFSLSQVLQLIDDMPSLQGINSHLHKGFDR